VLDIALVDGESAEAMQPFLEELQEIFEVQVLLRRPGQLQKDGRRLRTESRHLPGPCQPQRGKLVGDLGEQVLKHSDSPSEGVEATMDDFIDHLQYFQLLVALRPSNGQSQLWQLFEQYRYAPAPTEGEKATIWYRFRRALQRWWSNWSSLTLDQQWRGPAGVTLDGTNNATEPSVSVKQSP
jgi:hypothetical protein